MITQFRIFISFFRQDKNSDALQKCGVWLSSPENDLCFRDATKTAPRGITWRVFSATSHFDASRNRFALSGLLSVTLLLAQCTLIHASGICIGSSENDLCFRDATKTAPRGSIWRVFSATSHFVSSRNRFALSGLLSLTLLVVQCSLIRVSGVCLGSPENDLCFRDATKTAPRGNISSQISSSTEQLSLSTEQLFLSTEQLFLSTEQLFLSTEQLFLSTEQLFLSTERLFMRTEQLFLSTEQLFLSTEQLFLSTEQLFLSTEQLFLRIIRTYMLKCAGIEVSCYPRIYQPFAHG